MHHKHSWAVTLGVVGLTLAACSNAQAEMQAALGRACSGQSVPEAATYGPGPGPHALVVLADSGERHDWSDEVPEEWSPASVGEAELVACVSEQKEETIEVCPYNGPDITRYRYSVTVRLLEARTGATVGATALVGADPRNCQSTEDYDLTRLEGPDVSFNQARDWLAPYVEGAGQPSGTADAIAGVWSGTAFNGATALEVWITIRQGCRVGDECGPFSIPSISCSGTFTLLSIDGPTYAFQAGDLQGSCGDADSDTLTLLEDGTLLYVSRGGFGETSGTLVR